jgi:hypothetical protein
MDTEKQRTAARRNVKRAAAGARAKKSIAFMPKKTRSALGRQGAAAAQRKGSGGSTPKPKMELYEEATARHIAGRSKMGPGELAKALGQK